MVGLNPLFMKPDVECYMGIGKGLAFQKADLKARKSIQHENRRRSNQQNSIIIFPKCSLKTSVRDRKGATVRVPKNQAVVQRSLIRKVIAILSEPGGLPRLRRKDMKHQIQDSTPAMGTFEVRHGFGFKFF